MTPRKLASAEPAAVWAALAWVDLSTPIQKQSSRSMPALWILTRLKFWLSPKGKANRSVRVLRSLEAGGAGLVFGPGGAVLGAGTFITKSFGEEGKRRRETMSTRGVPGKAKLCNAQI